MKPTIVMIDGLYYVKSDDYSRLQRILQAVKAYPYIPQGMAAMIERMEKEEAK